MRSQNEKSEVTGTCKFAYILIGHFFFLWYIPTDNLYR